MKFSRYITLLCLTASFPLVSGADDYYCYNNPGSPDCLVPVELLTDPSYTSSGALAAFNANYINQVVSSGGSFTSGLGSSSSTSSETGETSSPQGSIGINSVVADNLYINVYPFTYNLYDELYLEASLSSLVNTDSGNAGFGDSSIGFSYLVGHTSFFDSFSAGMSLSLPTGDSDKGFSSLTHMLSLNGGFKKYFKDDLSYMSINMTYSTEVELPCSLLCTTEYIDYGDTTIFSIDYSQNVYRWFNLDFKYISTKIEQTVISDVAQDDAVTYEDIVVSIDTTLLNIPFSTGVIIAYDETYSESLKALEGTRDNLFFFSLTQPF